MKRQWDPDELIEAFSLLPHERAILPSQKTNGTPYNRLGFAVLLKFFQLEARFPHQQHEVPQVIVRFIAQQLDLSNEDYPSYKWSGRTHLAHRTQIRAFLGFRRTTRQDEENLKQWLIANVLPCGNSLDQLEEQVYRRLRESKLEPPTPKQIKRLIQSTVHRFEQSFYASTLEQLSNQTRASIDALLKTSSRLEEDPVQFQQSVFHFLKTDPGKASLKSIFKEIEKLNHIRQLEIPKKLFASVSPKLLHQYRRRASTQPPRELRRCPPAIRYTLVSAFCWQRQQEITDNLVELLTQIVHRIYLRAERRIEKELMSDFKRVTGKPNLLFRIAEASLDHPDKLVKEVVYPVADLETLQGVVDEFKLKGPTYRERVHIEMRSSYLHHYRRMVPQLLETLEFCSNNNKHQPLIHAIELLKKYKDSSQRYYGADDNLYISSILSREQQELIVERDEADKIRVTRVNYEICILQSLRDKLRCREIWVLGAKRYGNPEQDLPLDFEQQRETYYQELQQPLDAEIFIEKLQQEMQAALSRLNQGMPKNPTVRISKQGKIKAPIQI